MASISLLSLALHVLVFPGGMFALALGLLLKGVDRKVTARLQRRIGPPLLQPVYDLAKLMKKTTMTPATAQPQLFHGVPLVGAACMAVAATLVPIAGVYAPPAGLGDLVVLAYLLAIPAIALMLAGSASGSPYGAIGFSREMALVMGYEMPLLLAMLAVALRVGRGEGGVVSFALADIVAWQRAHGSLLLEPLMWPSLLAFLACVPANLGIAPFDIPEAETEVLEGPLLEYSGPSLGLFQMMAALKLAVVLGLALALFWPAAPAGWAALPVHLGKCLALTMLGVSLVRATRGRMRIDQAFSFFLTGPTLLAVLGLLMVLVWG